MQRHILCSRLYKHEFLKDFLSTGQHGKNPMASKGYPLHGLQTKLIEKAQGLFNMVH